MWAHFTETKGKHSKELKTETYVLFTGFIIFEMLYISTVLKCRQCDAFHHFRNVDLEDEWHDSHDRNILKKKVTNLKWESHSGTWTSPCWRHRSAEVNERAAVVHSELNYKLTLLQTAVRNCDRKSVFICSVIVSLCDIFFSCFCYVGSEITLFFCIRFCPLNV